MFIVSRKNHESLVIGERTLTVQSIELDAVTITINDPDHAEVYSDHLEIGDTIAISRLGIVIHILKLFESIEGPKVRLGIGSPEEILIRRVEDQRS